MKREFTVIELLIFVAILGLVGALLIPGASTAQQKSKARLYTEKITELIDGYEVQIKVENYSEEDKKALLGYLNRAQTEVLYYGQVRSMDELRTKIAFLADKIELLERPEEWKRIALADPEKRAQDEMKTRLTIMETKLDALMNEKLTKWDVVKIFFLIMTGISAILVILKHFAPALIHGPSRVKAGAGRRKESP
jgi:Tfp pilus assembly protein PilE